MVWEDLDIMRYCWKRVEGSNIVKYLRPDQIKDEEHQKDPDTGEPLELVDDEAVLPVVEWLANHYTEFGCKLEIVTDKSQEGSQFCSGFGGIGGFLRYQVDFAAIEYDPTADLEGLDLDDYM